jgi:exosortase/archaeosortase family protein
VRFSQPLYPVRFWISGMGIASVIHLALLALCGASSGDLVVAVTGWLLVALLFSGDASLAKGCGWGAGMAGLILPGLGLVQTFRMAGFDLWYLKILSFILLGGVLLLSCGWSGLVSQWRLTAILLVVAAPEKCLEWLNYGGILILAHTRIAGFLLHCLGFDLAIRGTMLVLPTDSVEVQEACSGLILMLLLLKISIIASIAFPIRLTLRLMMCAAALLTGFTVGVARIAVLAAIVHKRDWFAQMHGPAGMSLFPLLGFLLYAPFLLPIEKPVAELLRKVRSNWRSATEMSRWDKHTIFTAAMGVAFGVCLLKVIWVKSPNSYLRPDTFVASGLPFRLAEPRPVPLDLRASRFNAVQGAWCGEPRDTLRVGFGRGADKWPVKSKGIVCSMSGALAGPDEMLQDQKIARFFDGQFGSRILVPSNPTDQFRWKISEHKKEGIQAVALIPYGSICVTAVNADGDTFFSTAEYASAQRATLFRLSTWKDFLLTGRPLKDLRYWMIVVVSEKSD